MGVARKTDRGVVYEGVASMMTGVGCASMMTERCGI